MALHGTFCSFILQTKRGLSLSWTMSDEINLPCYNKLVSNSEKPLR